MVCALRKKRLKVYCGFGRTENPAETQHIIRIYGYCMHKPRR